MSADGPAQVFYLYGMTDQPSLILLRGLPGAGKTALAETLSENGKHPMFSVDDYFTGTDGSYQFRYDENHEAYRLCEQNTDAALKGGAEKVFVHNTFTMDWEMEPYFKMAAKYGYRVFVVTVENRHGGSNNHGIPAGHLEKMAEKYRVVLR